MNIMKEVRFKLSLHKSTNLELKNIEKGGGYNF
jgi:hypothetical protein